MPDRPTRREASRGTGPKRSRPTNPTAKRARPEKSTAAKSRPGRDIPVVGIGASAGGLEAFKQLFAAMPTDSGAAFVLIQHLDPTHKSLTADLLARHTAMPVVEAREGMRVEANHVYTIPPNTDLAFADGGLHLSALSEKRGVRAPIDFFFASLAEALREKAIGIVLSGSGSDGSLGVKAIEGNDGMTMAQTPESAQYDAMPKSAIATGCVDYVLGLAEIPEALSKYLRHPYLGKGRSLDTAAVADGFQAILSLVHARTGYNLKHYKKGTLARRIARRMGLAQIHDHAQYLKHLREDQAECAALVKDLFIGVTAFFRDPPAWQALEQDIVKPRIARSDRNAAIRVWAPGCATGEEAYSIAMLLLEQLDLAERPCKLQVFASDIDQTALELARSGIYPASIAASVGPQRLGRFFTPLAGGDRYQVGKRLREVVVFAAQNLLTDPPFSKLDLVICRNLLIYIEPDAQKRLIPLFHFALNEQGALFLGNTESIGGQDDLFQTIDKKWRLFKRIGPTRYERIHHPELNREIPVAAAAALAREHSPRGQMLAQRQLLERYAPAAVLVDQAYNLLYFWGETEDYLIQPPGAPTQNLLAQLRQGLRGKVKDAAERALRSQETAVADVRAKRGDAIPRVTVTATAVRAGSDKLLLITFEDQPTSAEPAPRESGPEDSAARQFEAELKVAKQELQTTIEQYESANEELMAANEEVTSINEELQATNEELETSKEELQSVNEELATVNNQLQDKIEELEKTNTDLRNLLDSTDMATIFLDREFRIMRFTPATTRLLPLLSTDISRAISVFAQRFDAQLLRDAEQVLEKVVTIEAEVQTDEGRWYKRRLLPYHAADHRIDGVVVIYDDITALKQEQQRTASALDQLKAVNADLDHRVIERTTEAERRAVELRKLATELVFAEERERQRLATDLHEGLSQSLSLVNVKLSNLRAHIKHDKAARQELQDAAETLRHANESVRTLTFELCPPMLEDFGLSKALEWLAEHLQKTHGLRVDLQHCGRVQQLHQRIRFTLFRAARELLINVVKHAGVDHATLTLESGAGEIRLTVEDAGNGFDIAKVARERRRGFGLFSIRERLAYLGGEMTTESVPGKGTKMILRAPLEPEDRRSTTR